MTTPEKQAVEKPVELVKQREEEVKVKEAVSNSQVYVPALLISPQFHIYKPFSQPAKLSTQSHIKYWLNSSFSPLT